MTIRKTSHKDLVHATAVALLVAILASACQGPSSSLPSGTLAPVAGLGVLDWDDASFTVPIDQYAMSQRDVQIVQAAHTVLVLQCVNGRNDLDAAEQDNIRQWLAAASLPQRWYFGNWDAPYVAVGGGQMSGAYRPVSLGPRPLDHAKAASCVNDDSTVLGMQPASPRFGIIDLDNDQLVSLTGYWNEGFSRTMLDDRFKELTAKRNDCTVSKGYQIYYPNDDGVGALRYEDGWTAEQNLAADLAEAQCSDDIGYTQSVIDMVATYQQATIAAHEAELVAIKTALDQRVASAVELLTGLGLL